MSTFEIFADIKDAVPSKIIEAEASQVDRVNAAIIFTNKDNERVAVIELAPGVIVVQKLT